MDSQNYPYDRDSQTEREMREKDDLGEEEPKKFVLNKETLQIEEEAMGLYVLAATLGKMDYDEIYELVSELKPDTKGLLFQALTDHADHPYYED